MKLFRAVRNHCHSFVRWTALAALAAMPVAALSAQSNLPALSTNGQYDIVVTSQPSQTVHLKGLNLGGWFIMECYMTPTDACPSSYPATTYYDSYRVMNELQTRFNSVPAQQQLVSDYENAWITTGDIDTIAAAGFNLVRIPVWWGQFYPLSAYNASTDDVPNGNPGTARTDAFTILDTIIAECAKKNVYVIIDMHGAFGGQSGNGDTGYEGRNQYFGTASNNIDNQNATVAMWKMIATHYIGNGTVAAFDLLNEPTGIQQGASTPAVGSANIQADVISQYNNIYTAIRSVDPYRMLVMESCFGSWALTNLPAPGTGGANAWTNVVYSTHMYPGASSTNAQLVQHANNVVSEFQTMQQDGYNVPAYIGEFQAYNTSPSSWPGVEEAFDSGDLSWSYWNYKAIAGTTSYWGWYDPTSLPARPSFSTDSQQAIDTNWKQYTTTNLFVENSTQPTTPQ